MRHPLSRSIALQTRIIGVLIAPLLAILVVSEIGTVGFRHFSIGQRLIVSSLLFFLLTAVALVRIGGLLRGFTLRAKDVSGITLGVVLGVLAYVGLLLLLGRVAFLPTTASVAILVAASCEEFIYRVILPAALLASSASAKHSVWSFLLAVTAAQIIFALSHVLPGLPGGTPGVPLEIYRLFVAGMMYAVVVATVGVWVTAAFHAALNVDQFFVTGDLLVSAQLVTTIALGSLPLILYALRTQADSYSSGRKDANS